MSHHPVGVRRTMLAVAGATLLTAAFVPAASAETLLTGPDAPLIVKGDACVGPACESGEAPSRTFVVRNTDTPVVRLDQTNAGGFTPQTWDVAGNEANFFVRDQTGGSKLPFRIAPGAPTDNLTLRGGRVGIGTWNPAKGLDIVGADGETGIKVTEGAATVEARTLAELTNKGPVEVRLTDSAANVGWALATAADGTVALLPTGPGAVPSLVLSPSGDVTAAGVVQQTADPARQTGVETADEAAIVAAIKALPVERYGLDGDTSGAKHLAPNGAAFRSAFALGASDGSIAPGDVGSVALVGVKALLDGGAGDAGDLARALAKRADAQEARLWAAEEVARGHEQRMRKLEHQASLAEGRHQRSSRAQRRLSTQVSSLRRENARLSQRLAAVEAAIAKRR